MTSDQEWGKLPIDRKIGTQISAWSQRSSELKKPFITISREYGSEGWILGQKIEDIINEKGEFDPPWVAYNKEILSKFEHDEQLSQNLVESLEKPISSAIEEFFDNYFGSKPGRFSIFKKTAKVIKALASHGHVILVGRGSCFITQEMKNGFHVRVVAPFDWRVETISKQQNISHKESEKLITKMEKERDGFIKEYFFTDVSDPHFYDIVINSSKIPLDDAAHLILFLMKRRGLI